MTKKTYAQLFLISILVIISLLVFFKYFKKTNLENDSKTNMEKTISTDESLIQDLKYLSTDKEGNEYKIEAKKGNIDKDNPDIIYLETVNAFILLQNSEFISIKSKFAKYNTRNYDTLFNNSVSIDYGEHLLKSEFLDLSFENSLVSIYDNVRYLSGISSLNADRAEIDILKKTTKVFMDDPNKKIQINNKSKNGNN
ncbi:LPS export ABC transporter periplasmic protein LptC [Candidatus Pelagibacter sp.]|nr:LPS export ABC transporter periplasmic protein LptC [Candidatus Pelagibacter sp.]